MNAKFHVTLAPLNVTRKIHLNSQFLNRVKELGAIGQFIHGMLLYYRGIYEHWGTHPEEIPVCVSFFVFFVSFPFFFFFFCFFFFFFFFFFFVFVVFCSLFPPFFVVFFLWLLSYADDLNRCMTLRR